MPLSAAVRKAANISGEATDISGKEPTMPELQKVKASMMNAIHDLPLLVARDEGFFRDQGLDVEIVRTPGSGQRDSDHQALRSNIFERTMEALYDQGACD